MALRWELMPSYWLAGTWIRMILRIHAYVYEEVRGADRAEPNHSHSYAFVFHSSHLLLSSSLSGPPQPGASHNGMWGHG